MKQKPTIAWLPVYYGWVNIVAAAVMIVATLPGRTHGLGLMTEPLLKELAISAAAYGWMNFFAVLIGSTFGVPLGRFVDRCGARAALAVMTLALGLVTLWTAFIHDGVSMFIALTLVRGLAQSGLTAGGAALVGKWFRRRVGYAMSAYSILMGAGFVGSIALVGLSVPTYGWRTTWIWMGLVLAGVLAPLLVIFVRSTPAPSEPEMALAPARPEVTHIGEDYSLWQAVLSPTFWIFTFAYSLYAFSWTAITLFNETILAERGFRPNAFILIMIVLPIGGLIAQIFVGWLVNHWRVGGAMAIGMGVWGTSMAAFPFLTQTWHVALYAVGLGAAGSFIMVSHMAFYPKAFGRVHLGQIQGAAQIISVVISGLGPVMLDYCKQYSGSYAILFFAVAAVMYLIGVLALFVPLPARASH